MTFLHQALTAFLCHFRLWARRPAEAVLNVLLGIVYLVFVNQLFTVWLTGRIHVGVQSEDAGAESMLVSECAALGVTPVIFRDLPAARSELFHGRLHALISVEGMTPPLVELEFAGRNLLLDRELSGQLLRSVGRVVGREEGAVRLRLRNDRVTPEGLTTYVTAGMLVFLLLALANTNTGAFWIRELESGTLYTLFLTPASRLAIVAGRQLAGAVISAVILVLCILLCRLVVSWPLPHGRMPVWVGLLVLDLFLAGGVFFLIAVVFRQYRAFALVSLFAFVLLMFISGLLSPVETMPEWQRALAHFTPTFPAVRSMQAVMLGTDVLRGSDVAAIAAWTLATHSAGSWILHREEMSSR